MRGREVRQETVSHETPSFLLAACEVVLEVACRGKITGSGTRMRCNLCSHNFALITSVVFKATPFSAAPTVGLEGHVTSLKALRGTGLPNGEGPDESLGHLGRLDVVSSH